MGNSGTSKVFTPMLFVQIFKFIEPVEVLLTFKACLQLYIPPGLTFKNSTWWLHSVYVFSEQTATSALHNVNSLVFITEVESVYSAVQTEPLYNTDMFCL